MLIPHRMMKSLLPFLLFALSSAEEVIPQLNCINGIRTVLGEFTFAGPGPGGYWPNVCNNTLGYHSLWANAKSYCTEEEIEMGGTMFTGYCLEYGEAILPSYESVKPNLTSAFYKNMTVVNFDDIDEEKIWNTTILLSKSLVKEGIHTVAAFDEAYAIHAIMGWVVYGFWGSVLLFGIVYRLCTWIYYTQLARTTRGREGTPSKTPRWMVPFSKVNNVLRESLIIPTSFGTYHQRLFWGFAVPTRMESLVVSAYWLLSIITCAVAYDFFEHNLYYTGKQQIWRYVADRTGIVSYANLPVLWMFSGRNNIFLWATGWSFNTFNLFHRHIARVATIQAIIHSILWTLLEVDAGMEYFWDAWTQEYWYMGGLATIVMSLLLVLSSVWLRQRAYEAFLIIHIVLSIATIIGLFYHTAVFDGAFDPYLWPLVAIWCFDRFARIVRQVYCNIHVRFSGGVLTTSSTATYDQATNVIRLDVTPGGGFLTPQPNQHYFLYQPLRWRGWENHPFTLAGWSNTSDTTISGTNSEVASQDGQSPSPAAKVSTVVATTALSDTQHDPSAPTTLTFFIRPFGGWTTSLRAACLRSPTHTINPKILLEGPYGHSAPLHLYDTVVFIVGGTGISGATAYLQDHIARSKKDKSGKAGTRIRNIHLLWVTKQPELIQDVAVRELKSILGREDVTARFWATDKQSSPPSPTGLKEEVTSVSTPSSTELLSIQHGRPDVRSAVEEAVSERAGAEERIAVFVCGPAGMADDARAAVKLVMNRGEKGVEYVEESFGW